MPGPLPLRSDYKKFIAQQDRDIRPETAHFEQLPAPSMKPRLADWAKDVAVIYGAASLAKQEARVNNDLYFWDKRLSPYAYLIGRTYEDDALLQVASGKYAGEIVRFSHDAYYGFFDELAKVVGGAPGTPEFWRQARPILAKRGYRSGALSADHVVALLLHDRLEGGERISTSFDDFYASVHRFCAERPAAPSKPKTRGRRIELTEILVGHATHGETVLGAGDGVAYVAPGGEGLVTLRPGRPPERVVENVDVRALAVVGAKLYMISNDDDDDEAGYRLAVSSDGGRRFKTIATDYFEHLVPAPTGGVWTTRDKRLEHYTSAGRPRASHPIGGIGYRIGDSGAAGTYVFDRDSLRLVGGTGRSRAVTLPKDSGEIADVVVTPTGVVLVVTVEAGVLRSTDSGASWRVVPNTARRILRSATVLSTGGIAVAGNDLLISDDDGATFAILTAKLREQVQRIVQLGDELVLATTRYVYGVSLADMAGVAEPRGLRRIEPVRAAERRSTPARELSTYPAVVQERIWQIDPFDRTKAYVASESRGAVRVLENGSKVVYSKRLSRDGNGRFAVRRDWLVYETYPREVERESRRVAQQEAEWGRGRTVTGVLR